MNNQDEKLELNMIKEKIASFCIGQNAKDTIFTMSCFQDLDELVQEQEYMKNALSLVYAYSFIGLIPYRDIEPYLNKVEKKGMLFGEEIVYFIYQLKNVQNIERYFSINEIETGKVYDLAKQLTLPHQLLQTLIRAVDENGYVLDSASETLGQVRHRILSLEAKMRSSIEELKVTYKDDLHQENISRKDNHLVLAVKAGQKSKVKGVVHAVSATGRTLFIEPEQVSSINHQLMQARQEEQEEVIRILQDLSNLIGQNQYVLKNNQEIMIYLDTLFAKARYGVSIDGVVPEVNEDYGHFSMKQARHPLINKQDVVANDIDIHTPQHIFLISGSNTGGKTVVLKTVGLLSLMALCGLALPVKEAKIPFFDHVLVDLGDDQSIEESLSTFSSHMKKIVAITNEVTSHSLVLIDEIGSGTDPQEGQSIGEAILEYLHKRQCLTYVSTHYSALKQYAKREDYILLASVEFNSQTMQPTYRLKMNTVGNSYAIEISRKLGLNEDIVQRAFEIKEGSQSESERLLERLQNEQLQIDQEKEQLNKSLQEANLLKERYHEQLERLQKNKEREIKDAKEQANQILEDAKKYIDEVVEDLSSKAHIKPHMVTEAKHLLDIDKHQIETEKNVSTHVYKIGDVVKVLSVQRTGDIIAINKKNQITVSMGGLKINVKKDEIEYLHDQVKIKQPTSNKKSIQKASTQSYEINVIGLRYEEAMSQVDKFLDSALVHNYSMVRIVHGMGTGALRNGVRKMLDKNKFVVSYRDGGPNEGGLGATLVYFE